MVVKTANIYNYLHPCFIGFIQFMSASSICWPGNWTTVNIFSNTCAFPAMMSQNVYYEKGL